MKTTKIAFLASVILLVAAFAQAQIAVDPNNDSCWDSVSSLRACQQLAVERAAAQAQQCTSFPEYQCAPEQGATQTRTEAKKPKKQNVKGVSDGSRAGDDAVMAVDYAARQR